MQTEYAGTEPSRAQIDEIKGPAVVEFGAPWCGYCRNAQPLIAAALAGHAGVHHLKIEDGRGRKLGRSFRVKLWPTLIFLRDGKELVRVVRPTDSGAISLALARIEV